jgi:bilirubin oxidase
MMNAQAQVAGPFNINGEHFDMDTINETVYLNTTEKWRITNQTGIAHPFHIHDVFFYVLNVNGGPVPDYLQGKKDVVLVMPMQYVEFITKFEDFANDTIPYMYHCHLLHHEDDGMMGSFRLIGTTATGIPETSSASSITVYPNPAGNEISVIGYQLSEINSIEIYDMLGQKVFISNPENRRLNPKSQITLDVSGLKSGIYFLTVKQNQSVTTRKIVIQ